MNGYIVGLTRNGNLAIVTTELTFGGFYTPNGRLLRGFHDADEAQFCRSFSKTNAPKWMRRGINLPCIHVWQECTRWEDEKEESFFRCRYCNEEN